jgi:hypothetical protein
MISQKPSVTLGLLYFVRKMFRARTQDAGTAEGSSEVKVDKQDKGLTP